MSIDDSLYWLRDAKFTDRYLVAGKPWDLVSTLSFLEGMRERAEHVGFMIQRLWPVKRQCRDYDIMRPWEILNKEIPIDRAFLLDTRWYKQTVFIGPIVDQNEKKHFIKFFKNRDDAALANHQSDFMMTHFGKYFNVVPVKVLAEVIADYPLIAHSDTPIPFSELLREVKDITTRHFEIYQDNTKPLTSFITLDMPIMFKQHGSEIVWQQVRDFIQSHDGAAVNIVPTHGDMVPWNTFYSEQGEMTLVDYERSGWQAPFYDFFHLVVQPGCMRAKEIDVQALLRDIYHDTQQAIIWFILYLLDQLRFDMDSYYNQQQQYPRLKKTIDIKLNLLTIALKDIKNS